MKLSRRQMFQMTALYAAAGTSGFGVPAYLPKAFGNDAPNSRLRVGAIGVGHRGRYDASLHQRHAELAVLADLDRRHLDASNHAL